MARLVLKLQFRKMKIKLKNLEYRMKLNNVRLLVNEFYQTFIFYRDILGLELEYGSEDGVYASFKTTEGSGIALFKRNLMSEVIGTAELPAETPMQDKQALVFAVNNVDQVYQRLKAQGCRFLNQPTDMSAWGIRVVHLRDPDGHLIELYTGSI